MNVRPGTRLGPYEIVAFLGAGGMGEVYRGRDTRLGRAVAIKVIPRDMAGDTRRVKRFELEARAAGALSHPNIVAIHDVGAHKGIRFVVMELADGRSLRECLRDGPLSLRAAVEIAAQAAAALGAAHDKGIVHRDLTPGNVMVDADGRVKVLDFGLAKLVAHPEAKERGDTASRTRSLEGSSLSSSGTVAGTVPYMSPEQLRGEAVDPRSDLFALGVVLYEMVAGRRPFLGETGADVASAILRDAPTPARSLRTDAPEDLDRLIAWCLEKEPERRPASARAVAEELRRVAARFDAVSPGADTSLDFGDVPHAPAAPARAVPSIAVLPFVNRSPDEDDDYFAEGLADELLNVLAKIQGLLVVGRTSSRRFKGTDDDTRTIGRKLNVATLLEGSVRTSGSRVRISVQLVKADDGFQLWAESYDRTLDDIFAVQDDIAQSVVRSLRTTLLGEAPDSKARAAAEADVAVAVRGRGAGGEAYRLYLQGRHFVTRTTREDIQRGIGYLIEALQTDPNFALAWAELSGAYASEAGYGWYPIDAGTARARKAAERALSLEPDLAEGHVRLGSLQMNYDRDWPGAEASFRRALELAPGDGFILRLAGNMVSNLGNLEEGRDLYQRAVEQDPLSPAGYQTLGLANYATGRLREAEDAFRMSLELGPQRVGVRWGLALVLLAQGRGEEAIAMAGGEPEEVFRLLALAIIFHTLGRRAESDEQLAELIEKYAAGGAYQIAEACAARGEIDEAFRWLDRAYAQHDPGLVEILSEPLFRPLHVDPRWGIFRRHMGFGL